VEAAMNEFDADESERIGEIAADLARRMGLSEPNDEILKVARDFAHLTGSPPPYEGPPFYRQALQKALASRGWSAGTSDGSRDPDVRLPGGQIDGMPSLVSDLFVVEGSLSITTRLPILIRSSRRYEASLLCSTINTAGGWVISIDTEGVPIVISKCYLGPDPVLAAAQIVDVILTNRTQAARLTDTLGAIDHGETAAAVISSFAQPAPFNEPFPTSSLLDLSHAPMPSPDMVDDLKKFRDHPSITEAEMTAMVRVRLLDEGQPDAAPCAGPLVIHADGITECFACTNPETRLHVGGTAACGPHARLGYGYICGRCGRDD
jgi:hypothetical protein